MSKKLIGTISFETTIEHDEPFDKYVSALGVEFVKFANEHKLLITKGNVEVKDPN